MDLWALEHYVSTIYIISMHMLQSIQLKLINNDMWNQHAVYVSCPTGIISNLLMLIKADDKSQLFFFICNC